MELILERIAKRKTYTIGRLYIRRQVVDEYLPGTADDFFCDTLEPTWRDYANGAYKVKGRSAIPEGNCSEDTEGCILIGKNREVGKVLDSRIWVHRLKQKIVETKGRGEPVWITIK